MPAGNIGYTHLADLDQVPSRPTPPHTTGTTNADQHGDSMHSSQQPAARLPLTKGVTVDGIVKRLSQERFSPAPAHAALHGPTFSYTRPNAQTGSNEGNHRIMYTQVMKDIEPLTTTTTTPTAASALQRGASPQRYAFQGAPQSLSPASPVPFGGRYAERSPSPSPTPLPLLRPSSLSPPRRSYDETDGDMDERPIVPIIRRVEYQYPEMHALSNRRQLLESRLHSRRLGGSAELLDAPSTSPPPVAHSPRILRHHIVQHATTSTPIADVASPAPAAALYANQPECPPRRRWRAKSVERAERAPYIEDCFDEPDGELDYRQQTTLGQRPPGGHQPNVIDLGYIDDMDMEMQQQHAFHQNRFREKYRQEFEPQSLDSQFGEFPVHPQQQQTQPTPLPQQQQQQRSVSPLPLSPVGRVEYRYAEPVHSLRREPKAQRSFDRGDSGIERDYQRKSSSGAADDFSTGSR